MQFFCAERRIAIFIEETKRRCRVCRATAQTRCDRQFFIQPKGDGGNVPIAIQFRRTIDQVALTIFHGKATAKLPFQRQRKPIRLLHRKGITLIQKSEDSFQLVVAIFPPFTDVQCQVDLAVSRRMGNGHYGLRPFNPMSILRDKRSAVSPAVP